MKTTKQHKKSWLVLNGCSCMQIKRKAFRRFGDPTGNDERNHLTDGGWEGKVLT